MLYLWFTYVNSITLEGRHIAFRRSSRCDLFILHFNSK